MATFFSSTDINTLEKEGKDTNHFLSLIVNNKGAYSAAITRQVKYVTKKFMTYSTFSSSEKTEIKKEEGSEIQAFDLKVEFAESDLWGLDKRITELQEKEEEEKRKEKEKKAKKDKSILLPDPSSNSFYPNYDWSEESGYPYGYGESYYDLYKDENDINKMVFVCLTGRFPTSDYEVKSFNPKGYVQTNKKKSITEKEATERVESATKNLWYPEEGMSYLLDELSGLPETKLVKTLANKIESLLIAK